VYGSPARLRVEREEIRRSNAPVVISTLLSLLVVGAAIAGVAYLVLRAPSSAVDSAERLEPVGTALPAPSEPPAVSTPIPTSEPDREPEPEPTALGFTGEAPAVAGLPTVAAPQEITSDTAGPTPTPRVIALPTAVPPTAAAPAPTLPPPVDVADVPVVALAPVEVAPPPAPTATAPQPQAPVVTEPTPVPVVIDDDPFNIFEDGEGSGIVPAQNDALERARALQGSGNGDRAETGNRDNADPVIVPAPIVPSEGGRDGTVEIVMPDVDAMIDEITARATDPNRNPNVGNVGQQDSDRTLDNDDVSVVAEPRENRRKSARERINERNRGRSSTSGSRSVVVEPVVPIPNVPVIVPSGPGNDNQECEDPFANLPEDMRPDNFPFSNC
jgi:hypothetical protein